MLVLCRKMQQQIQIGENIVVTVLQIKGQTVRLGIEAPRDVHVLRTELSITPDQITPASMPRPEAPRANQPAARPHNRLRRWPVAMAPLPAPKG